MKQVIAILAILLVGFIGWDYYKVYDQKDYSSIYTKKVKSSNVTIAKIEFNKDKIDKLNNQIKTLKVDPVYTLQLKDIKGRSKQPLFIDNHAKIYNKILLDQRKTNNYK